MLCFKTCHLQAKLEALKMNGTHPLLIYVNDVNLLTESMKTIREKKTQPLLIDCKHIGHETDAEEAKYMFMSRQKNAGQNKKHKNWQ
jgi:hypothetical protein